MTRRDPNREGESPGSTFGIWLCVVAGSALFLAVASLAANLADRIGGAL
jgi:hypothetical protein